MLGKMLAADRAYVPFPGRHENQANEGAESREASGPFRWAGAFPEGGGHSAACVLSSPGRCVRAC